MLGIGTFILLLFPFDKRGIGGPEWLTDLPKVAHLVNSHQDKTNPPLIPLFKLKARNP